MTVNVRPPQPTRMFGGTLFSDILESRYLSAIGAVYNLEPHMFGPDLDPAGSIMRSVDVTLPTIGWDTPQRVDGITPDQQRVTVLTYPVSGDTAPLTWVPRRRQIGMPSARFGLTGGSVAVVCVGYSIAEDRVSVATDRARRYIETEQGHLAAELQTWRDDTARRIRDAVTARRKLLDTLPA